MADISVTPSAVVAGASALVEHGGRAGAAVSRGQVVYKDASDGNKLKLSDNDGGTSLEAAYGIALNDAGPNQPLSVIRRGPLTMNAVLTAGTVYAVSGTPGGIAPLADVASGDDVILLGVATSTTVLDVQINDTGVTL